MLVRPGYFKEPCTLLIQAEYTPAKSWSLLNTTLDEVRRETAAERRTVTFRGQERSRTKNLLCQKAST